MHKVTILLICIFILVGIFSYGEGENQNSSEPSTSAIQKEEKKPQPYSEDEFPRWLRELRRGEIVFFGSIPFMLFFSFEGYDLYRYFSNGMSPAYSPWPFRGYNAVPYTNGEKLGILVSSLSLSFILAVSDYLLGVFQFPKTEVLNSKNGKEGE